MKASEVLRRYAAEERDFRHTDLRGQSFKGQDVSGADFSEADIRGANFSNAFLRGANFTGAKAGVQRHWTVVQLIIILMLVALSGILSGFAGILTAYFLINQKYATALGIPTLMFLGVLFVAIIRHGLVVETFGTLAITLSVTFTLAFALAFTFNGVAAGTFALVVISAIAGVVIIACASSFTGGNFDKDKTAFPVASIFALALAVTSGLAIQQVFINLAPIAIALAIFITIAILLLGIYMALCALQSDRKYLLIQRFSVIFNAIGGTCYYNADLTGANFTKATLKSASFREATLRKTSWQYAQKLDRARLGNSTLSNPAVRELLVTRDGYKKSYVDANLRGANLNGVDLNEANLKWADLGEATFHHADLREADLSETLVLGADFTGASLTGACLEGWNIDHTTNLEGVDCQYVYLLRNQQERRPSSGDFAPGEFTKLFQEVLSTVDLIFRNGVDWRAFVTAFQQVQVENEDTRLEIQSIENKGDGVAVVRVSVPPDTNKEKIHSEFNHQYELALKALEARYQAELQAKEGEISRYREDSANMWEVIKLQAKKPIHVQAIAEAKTMNNSNDSSQSVNIGGNATGSTINLGTISGNITNTINQLPDSDPDQPNLKQLLMQLKDAIETDSDLPDTDKADLLEQVQNLAEAKKTEEPAQKEGLARRAKKMFEATLKSLPDTAKIVEASSKLLPLILKALGFPV